MVWITTLLARNALKLVSKVYETKGVKIRKRQLHYEKTRMIKNQWKGYVRSTYGTSQDMRRHYIRKTFTIMASNMIDV